MTTTRAMARMMLVAAALCVPPAAATTASASDYSNVCRTADGSYEIDDGELRAVDPAGRQMPAIPYTKVRETVLSHEAGHCLSDAAKGQTFKYEARSSALRIAFTDGGQTREADFICELAADGLPAAYTCDRRVVTAQTGGQSGGKTGGQAGGTADAKLAQARPQPAAAASREPPEAAQPRGRRWTHNGSLMRLDQSSDERRFVYEAPRDGLRRVGVKPGTLLFEGRMTGAAYAGTAYVFAPGCPPQPYAVNGRISDGGRRLVLNGRAPQIGPSCNVTGGRDDTLVFTWKP